MRGQLQRAATAPPRVPARRIMAAKRRGFSLNVIVVSYSCIRGNPQLTSHPFHVKPAFLSRLGLPVTHAIISPDAEASRLHLQLRKVLVILEVYRNTESYGNPSKIRCF